ncbi:MAG: tRNA (N(6)-L-threonylcarbamoyladenosine(37)-C(2))-methylthiotransferase MtaB [Oscillospiraceae bacterium]|nr:tRNA (N(6)-L-threonylcarbamoyladenosine(37)-C(2))-methylthiotransferase MtaB [Oscillospiraceae bacterium]
MKFAFFTLGCKVNQYETQAMEQLLRQWGHSLGDFEERCDCYIVNTCTVTAVGDKKSRNMVRRARKRNPAAVIGVCGCYAQVSPGEVEQLDVDVIGGSGNREQFLHDMERAAREKIRLRSVDEARRRYQFEILPPGGLPERTRAMLKVEDGCDNFCAYCIIPYARGPVRSLPVEDAVRQAGTLAGAGYLELVVTGIEISSWGRDLPGEPTLTDLLEAVCRAAPAMRVRLGSLEPRTVTEDFCRRLSGMENLCPQFHLSLQSGSDAVLRRMCRRYDTARYRESVRRLRAYFPGCAVTTDLIVAFPGETEEEFRESLDFIQDCGLAAVHVFPYSRRTGTPAAKLPDQHGNAVKEQRSREAVAVAEALSETYRRGMIGTEQEVLFEQQDGEYSTGHAPNSVLVYLPGPPLHNVLRRVRITGLHRDGAAAEAVPEAGPAPD